MKTPFYASLLSLLLVALGGPSAHASIAYGSINNFDTVNDTGQECHGFEIEMEDCRSTDITYTYNYNHYGVPEITQDDSLPGHPKCLIRWASKKNPDNSWAAHTIVPTAPITPTDGHMFTNPSVNFGGEHFGVGYSAAVGAIRYNWLVDNGSGTLINGGVVQVSTPVYNYYPAVVNNPAPAQVQAVIAPPPPPVPEPKEFGKPVWVKEIRTTSHNKNKVKLRDLVSDDPNDANEVNWRNNEADEVETEWQILQKDYNKADGGANNEVPAAAEDLPGGDEVVTRRYEFFEYTGPLDTESGEAMAQAVAADGVHGVGSKLINGVNVDLSMEEIVGNYTGAQMAAVDVDAVVGLIDHVGEGRENTPFAARTVVVGGTLPFTAVIEGLLPAGMTFDEASGVLSGTPEESGDFNFRVIATDFAHPEVAKNYTLRIAAVAENPVAAGFVDTIAEPLGSGTTTGDGAYPVGSNASVEAMPEPGYHFVNWTDNGHIVSTNAIHTFVIDVNHSLIAHFAADIPQVDIALEGIPVEGGTTSGGGLVDEGSNATVHAVANVGYQFTHWTESGVQVSTAAHYSFVASMNRTLVAHFSAVPTYSISTSVNSVSGGTASGGGSFSSGSSATVIATANAGYVFSRWTVNGNQVSTFSSYTFTVAANKSLVANFIAIGTQQTITTNANPVVGGIVSGGGSYASGDSATVVAVPNPNYAFVKWQVGSSQVSTSPSYTFTVAGNITLVAKFKEVFVVTAGVASGIGGSTEVDSPSYEAGDHAKVKAMPDGGFTFLHWTDNGTVVSADEMYDFNVNGNRSLVAHFRSTSGFTITTSVVAEANGIATGAGVYASGDDVIVSARASEGYGFASWTEEGTVVSTDADYWFTADAHRNLVANFVPAVSITAAASSPEGGTVYGDGFYALGSEVILSAIANPGYSFQGWSENGTYVSTEPDYVFNATAGRTLIANFIALPAVTIANPDPGQHQLVVFWPADSPGWELEESTNLETWVPSIRTVTNDGLAKSVSINASGTGRYFRLSHP